MKRWVATIAGLLTALSVSAADDVEIDSFSGFPMTGDWQLVRANCIACHSPKLITQQRGTADQWLAMIRWMQKKQNLWEFQPDVEQKIVAYLAEHFPPSADRRRAAIPPDLMPPNPFAPPVAAPEPESQEN
jgi:hypothetical protein